MKRKISVIAVSLIVVLFSTFVLTACEGNKPPHTHEYSTLKYDSENHWKECSCGEKDSIEEHTGGTATQTARAVCSVCMQEYGMVLCASHSYTKQVIKAKYLRDSATCESKAKYYYSCVCGVRGTEFFEYGEILGHAYGEKVSNGFSQHVQTCANDNSHTVIEDCYGGTPTLTQRPICEGCNCEYGEELGHVHAMRLTKVEAKTQSCTTEGNIEYYACTCGKWFTDSSATTEITDRASVVIIKDSHSYSEYKSDEQRHWKECACGRKISIGNHKGGTATCAEKAICTTCNRAYGITKEHSFHSYNFCKNCYGVYTDMSASVVELGIPTRLTYSEKDTSNCAWDTHYYNGKIYRGCGDYSDDSKAVTIWSYDVEKFRWNKEILTSDTAIQRFVEVDGKLMAPGTDPTGSWSYGNCYFLDENGWTTNSSVPNGIHMFDVIGYDGKVFYGLGVNYKQSPLTYSENGTDYTTVYFYKNNVKLDLTQSAQGLSPARVYELFTFKGDLYALLIYQGVYGVYKFDGTKMNCVNEEALYGQFTANYNVWISEFERDGIFYMVSNAVYAISDFSDAFAFQRYTPSSQVDVCDAIYRDGKYYLLCYSKTVVDGKYKTIIYESETMKKDSFVEVVSFDYEITPLTFDKAGDEFYVSMGGRNSILSAKNGMLLKVKAN